MDVKITQEVVGLVSFKSKVPRLRFQVETPVRFRTSPPLEALKPRRAGAGAGACACAPASPRRRRAALPPPRRHRPALDFDKMQQVSATLC